MGPKYHTQHLQFDITNWLLPHLFSMTVDRGLATHVHREVHVLLVLMYFIVKYDAVKLGDNLIIPPTIAVEHERLAVWHVMRCPVQQTSDAD